MIRKGDKMKVLLQLVFLFVFYSVIEGMTQLLSIPFPATLISMMLLIALLLMHVIQEKWIHEGSKILLRILPILFIPAGVRILDYLSLLKGNVLVLFFIVLVSTFLTFMATLGTVNLLSGKEKSYERDTE